jgi:hypothetical protein
MDWLDDIARKQSEGRRQTKEKSEALRRRYQAEFRRVSPMVKRLLRDLGDKWVGRPFLPWKKGYFQIVTSPRVYYGSPYWNLQIRTLQSSEYFDTALTVRLCGVENSRPHFLISRNELHPKTEDTSEEALIHALRTVAATLNLG